MECKSLRTLPNPFSAFHMVINTHNLIERLPVTIRETFGIEDDGAIAAQKMENLPKRDERIQGKIFHLGKGYGFVESDAIPYTRIFFHWQNLEHDTLHFTKLKRGMTLEFSAVQEKNNRTGILEWRAREVKVINGD